MNETLYIPLNGKLYDAGDVTEGGRIDRHWGKHDIDRERYSGTDDKYTNPFFYDPQKAIQYFQLRSIEFGNWMNQEDRANFLYGATVALYDLAYLLNITPQQTGFYKKLSISLGARGQGRAAGHYEALPTAVINITKTQGEGVFAHEYGHAFDNLLSFYTGGKKQSFVSGGRSIRKELDTDILNKGNWFERQFELLFNQLFYKDNGEETDYHQALKKETEYYNRRNEIWARTFETYLSIVMEEEDLNNPFLLASGTGKGHPPVKLVKALKPHIEQILQKGFLVLKDNIKPTSLNGTNHLIKTNGFRKTLKKNGNVEDTLLYMKQIAKRDAHQVSPLADYLRGDTVKQTAQNIWNYLRQNTRYQIDTEGIEELRTPARSLVDGKQALETGQGGIDCDDYTILVSALLLNLGIPHEYRVAAYKQKGKYQHIYPVAFDKDNTPYIIDLVPEIPHFNYEAKPIIDLKTIPMEIHELSGIAENHAKEDLMQELHQPFTMEDHSGDELLEANFLSGLGEVQTETQADIVLQGADDIAEIMERGLLAELNKAKITLLKEQKEPTVLSQTINVQKELDTINAIMQSWDDEAERKENLQQAIMQGSPYANFYQALLVSLDEIEDQALNGMDDDTPIYLARMNDADPQMGKIFKKGALKNLFKKVGSGVKKAVKTVVRYNPATIILRNSILLVLKLNLFKIASRLIYGYLSQEQANAQNLDLGEWAKLVDAKNKAEAFFVKAGGKQENFKNAIITGRAAKVTGVQLSGFGEVVTAATATTAASGFIAFAKKLLSAVNPVKLFKKVAQKIKERKAMNNENAAEEVVTSEVQDFNDETSTVPEINSQLLPTSAIVNNETSSSPNGKPSFMDKLKTIWKNHKKKIVGAAILIIITIVGIVAYKKWKKKKKRSLAGLKGARTRKRNTTKRYPQLKGSTTILKLPSKTVSRARVSKKSNTARLKEMHRIAKQLQKQNPKTKYSTLLKRAAKQL